MRLSRRRLVACARLGSLAVFCKEKPPSARAGDGGATTISRDVAPFSRISVGSKILAEITIGTASRLELEGDRNLVAVVTSRSENGTLTLKPTGPIRPSMTLRARISVPSLDSAHATGAAVIDIQGLAAEKFEARTERAGKVQAQGAAKALVLDGKDAGAFDFRKVAASSATVRLERGARAELGYLENLDVTLSGAAMALYEGTPEIKKSIKHPARLIRRDQ